MTEPKKGLFVRSSRLDAASSEKTLVELYPGDTVEYGLTHEVELPDRTRMWVKVGSTTKVIEGESARDAANRLVGFVHDQVRYRIVQAAQDAGDLQL